MIRGRKGFGEVKKEHIFYHDVHDGITSLVLRSFTYLFFFFATLLSFFGLHTRYFELERAFYYELDGVGCQMSLPV